MASLQNSIILTKFCLRQSKVEPRQLREAFPGEAKWQGRLKRGSKRDWNCGKIHIAHSFTLCLENNCKKIILSLLTRVPPWFATCKMMSHWSYFAWVATAKIHVYTTLSFAVLVSTLQVLIRVICIWTQELQKQMLHQLTTTLSFWQAARSNNQFELFDPHFLSSEEISILPLSTITTYFLHYWQQHPRQ